MPISGEIIEFNADLESSPETVNTDPFGNGWMVKIKLSDSSQINSLMDAEAYGSLIG
jgi:glycine cleavage system H protein